MNLLLAAASGWGKSYVTQAITERNIPDYERTVVLDFKDEYRGLVSQEYGPGLCKHHIAGPIEVEEFDTNHYRELLEVNPQLVLARHPQVRPEDWREVCAGVIEAGRILGDVLFVIDEAHFVAPQVGGIPDPITGLATTGRGEGVSAAWVTQRLAKLDETVLAQCTGRFLGGFESDADLSKVGGVVDYPSDVHRSGGKPVEGLPNELHAEDRGAISLRKFTNAPGQVTGSEWVFSDDSGKMRRMNSRELSPACEHVGAQGKVIDVGV